MSTRYTKAEVASIVKEIETEAIVSGLIPADHRLEYRAGNTSYHIATTIRVVDGEGGYTTGLDRFIPAIPTTAGPTEQYRLLAATLAVFHALRAAAK
jgi:hypothetical protein